MRAPSPAGRRRVHIEQKVVFLRGASDEVFGSPRMRADLRADGEIVFLKTFAKALRSLGLVGIRSKKWKPPRSSTSWRIAAPTSRVADSLAGERPGACSLRNTVEGSYAHEKYVLKDDIANAATRRERGNTSAFIATATAVASANIRKVQVWIAQSATTDPINSLNRHSFGLKAEFMSAQAPLNSAPEPPPLE